MRTNGIDATDGTGFLGSHCAYEQYIKVPEKSDIALSTCNT